MYDKKTKAAELLDNLLTCSMAEAARRIGISPSLPWKWLMRSRMGDPEFQEIEFCDVIAPLHTHFEKNVPALAALQIQQSAIERARDGVLVDVFFQGVRQFEKRIKPEWAEYPADELWLHAGPDWETVCYERVPTKQWLKPSDALVIAMLQAWQRKRYGSRQEISVTYGGVLRLEKDAKPVIEAEAVEVFEDPEPEANDGEKRGGHLALAAPATSAEEFETRAAQGEFAQGAVTFVNGKGERTELQADLEKKLADIRRNGPVHKTPQGKVATFSPNDTREERITHPQEVNMIGTGREGIGEGPDPELVGGHRGFRMDDRR
jgi:hypothetical protein